MPEVAQRLAAEPPATALAPLRLHSQNGAGPPLRTLMLGKGWFPNELGGLDRYYRALIDHLPEASGVVIGGDGPRPERVTGVSAHDRPLLERLFRFWRAAQRAGKDADVVDAHFALYALAPLWLGRLRHKPVVLHFHGPWADESIAAGDGSGARRLARRLLERAAYSRAERAVVLTSAFRQVLVERYRVKPWDISVEAPGVDLERFTPGAAADARDRFGLAPEAFVAVSVRRLVSRMGLATLLEAWADALPSLPAGSTLLIAGDGPVRDSLEHRITTLGLGGSARLLGRVAEDELVDLYRAADVAVVPTTAHEGFGLVVTEAAACGTPTIVTNVGGLPEAVAGLDRTLIVPPGEPHALSERLVRARRDLPTREATRAYAERFDWSRVAERHRQIAHGAAGTGPRDKRLKVVYLDHVARMSGGEIALLRLLPHLDQVNAHVLLAEDGPLVGELHLAGISTEVLALGERARCLRKADVRGRGVPALTGAMTAAYVVRLAQRLRRLQPDLVHANSLKSGVYGSLAARLAGVPLIWHVRDRIAADYLPPAAVRLIRGMARRLPAAVIANSSSTMDTLVANGVPNANWSVFPDILSRAPVEASSRGSATYGIVGRLAPWKGQHLFLEAFASAFPDGPQRAVVVGGALFGEDDYARELPGIAAALGISKRVEFRGFRADVWDELSRLDVLVHASITPEPFGQVILEGMAAGVPVIAARAGGPAEILDENVNGLLYAPGRAADLATAMRRMQDPRLRDRLSANAREEVRRYEPQVVAPDLQRLYAEVVARAGTAR